MPMMTVHAAKGLEFDTVFLTGLEERLFPLRGMDALDSEGAEMEEERRLAYVAITRARRTLYATHTETRTIYGQTRYNEPSRFLEDLPEAHVQSLVTDNLRSTARGSELGAFGLEGARAGSAGYGWGRGASRFGGSDEVGATPAPPARVDRWEEPRAHAQAHDEVSDWDGRAKAWAEPVAPAAPAPKVDVSLDEPWRVALERARKAQGEVPAARSDPPLRTPPRTPEPAGGRTQSFLGVAPARRPTGGQTPARAGAEGAEREPGERYVERDLEAAIDTAEGGLVVSLGARVRHPKFGVGLVEGVEAGRDPTVTVQFPGWPKKRIKVSFLLPP